MLVRALLLRAESVDGKVRVMGRKGGMLTAFWNSRQASYMSLKSSMVRNDVPWAGVEVRKMVVALARKSHVIVFKLRRSDRGNGNTFTTLE